MTPRTGRPKSENPRTKVITSWVTPDEHEAFKAAAGETSMSDWLRSLGVAEVKRAGRRAKRTAED